MQWHRYRFSLVFAPNIVASILFVTTMFAHRIFTTIAAIALVCSATAQTTFQSAIRPSTHNLAAPTVTEWMDGGAIVGSNINLLPGYEGFLSRVNPNGTPAWLQRFGAAQGITGVERIAAQNSDSSIFVLSKSFTNQTAYLSKFQSNGTQGLERCAL